MFTFSQLVSFTYNLGDRVLGTIFASGNVGSAFNKWPKQHRCTPFCSNFGLEPLNDTADRAADSSESEEN